MELTQLIKHPEQMDRETLYDLRSLLALHPYYQTARLLMLQNLYILHDSSFDEELRSAAVYITDHQILFNLVEAAHYQLAPQAGSSHTNAEPQEKDGKPNGSRTIALIDNFLDSMPQDEQEGKDSPKRKPTPADATIDYVAYLLDAETEFGDGTEDGKEVPAIEMKGQSLIDNFMQNEGGKIQLKETVDYVPELENQQEDDEKEDDESYFTETLAKIYIKQGRYSKALEIIQRLNLNYPKKNAYFADQIRFLEKLILNNKQNN